MKRRGGMLSESETLDFLRQICEGFKEVHAKNIIHRDLKPANFLIHQGVVKISDFGFARQVEETETSLYLTFLGSPLYMAPQILAREKFNSKCDVWSLGVTLYELLYGKTPFTASNPPQLLKNIQTSGGPSFPAQPYRSDALKDLLRRMLTISEQDRISWAELFHHPVVTGAYLLEASLAGSQSSASTSNDPDLLSSFQQNETYLSRHRAASKLTSITSLPAAVEPTAQSLAVVAAVQGKMSPEQAPRPHTSMNDRKERKNSVQGVPTQSAEDAPNEVTVPTPSFISDIQAQNERISIYKLLESLDDYLRYLRNVSIYLNAQCNVFFKKCYQKVSEPRFYLGMYLLLRYQMQVLGHVRRLLSDSAETSDKKDSTTLPLPPPPQNTASNWDVYKHSPSYSRMLNLVNSDLNHLAPYFQQVSMRTLNSFASLPKAGFTDNLLGLLKNQAPLSQNVFEEAMQTVIDTVKVDVGASEQSLLNRLLVAMKPFHYLQSEIDFYTLYEGTEQQCDSFLVELLVKGDKL